MCRCSKSRYFYPRPPRGGRPHATLRIRRLIVISIHALREEGDPRLAFLGAAGVISIHALREEGDALPSLKSVRPSAISIHALREEGDADCPCVRFRKIRFLSTPSARRATYFCALSLLCRKISIHALREEGDATRGMGG